MSADNYYLIRNHPDGGYAAVMGFASSDETPEVRPDDKKFDTIVEALNWASDEYSEYGVSVHEECRSVDPENVGKFVVKVFDMAGNELFASNPVKPDKHWLLADHMSEIEGAIRMVAPQFCPFDCDYCRSDD